MLTEIWLKICLLNDIWVTVKVQPGKKSWDQSWGQYISQRFRNKCTSHPPSQEAWPRRGCRQPEQGLSETDVSSSKIAFAQPFFRHCLRLVTFELSCLFKFPQAQNSPLWAPAPCLNAIRKQEWGSERRMSPEELRTVFQILPNIQRQN